MYEFANSYLENIYLKICVAEISVELQDLTKNFIHEGIDVIGVVPDGLSSVP